MAELAHQILNRLYAERGAAAHRLAFLMTGDPTEAEDVVQDAFVRLYARFENRRSPEAVDRYLRRTIINLSHDRRRRQRTARSFAARSQPPASPDEASIIDARLALSSFLQGLPHRQRAALVLRYYEDLTEEQCADILKCTVGALKQLVQRGLRTLRQQNVITDD